MASLGHGNLLLQDKHLMALPWQPGAVCRVWTWLATPTHLAIHYCLISAMPSQSIVSSQGLALLGSSMLLLPTVDISLLGFIFSWYRTRNVLHVQCLHGCSCTVEHLLHVQYVFVGWELSLNMHSPKWHIMLRRGLRTKVHKPMEPSPLKQTLCCIQL